MQQYLGKEFIFSLLGLMLVNIYQSDLKFVQGVYGCSLPLSS